MTNNLLKWFKNNHMKSKTDRCHLLVTGDIDVTVYTGEFHIINSREEKGLVVKIDTKTSVRKSSLWKKAIQKLHTLIRDTNFMDLANCKCIIKAFLTYQFN